MKRIGVRLLLLCLAWALIARAPALAGEDRAALTLMVYMTGSDLESDGGAATQDIIEMMRSGFDADRVNLILCTGGAVRGATLFDGGAPALCLRPAERFDPWVVFCVTRKDGSACTRAAYYHECAVADDGSGPNLPFAPFF